MIITFDAGGGGHWRVDKDFQEDFLLTLTVPF